MKKKKAFAIASAIIAVFLCFSAAFFIFIFPQFQLFEGNTHESALSKVKTTMDKVIAPDKAPSFSSNKLNLYRNHIYCTDNAFERRSVQKNIEKEIKSYFPIIDQNLSDDVYFHYLNCGGHYNIQNYDYKIGFRQMINGAIIDDTLFFATVKDGKVTFTEDPEYPFLDAIQDLDQSALVPIDEILKTVGDHANDHADEMFFGEKEPLDIEYYLHYGRVYGMSRTDYYYEFIINEYSHIIIDPFSGGVIFESYWNGVYVD